jgi:CRP-like cAMP-binding protein
MISPETLRRFPLFGRLEPEMIKAIAMLGEEVSYSEGDWLFREGTPAGSLFLVLDGSIELAVSLNGASGPQARLNTRTPGEIIGWSALVPPHTYTLSGRAKTDTRLVQLDGPRLRELMDSDPAAGYWLMHNVAGVVGDRLVRLRNQFVSMTSS